MTLDIYHALTVLISQCFLVCYSVLLVDFRQPADRWRRIWAALVGLVAGTNVLCILTLDYWPLYTKVGALTMTLPYILLTLWCARYRGLRALFNITTTLFVGCVGGANGLLVQILFSQARPLSLLVRIGSFSLLYVILRGFSGAYRRMLSLLDSGWAVLCLIPITAFLNTLYITNCLLPMAPLPMTAVLYGTLLVCACAYWLMYLFFDRIQQETEARNSRHLREVQVSALNERIEAVHRAEQAIRVERHDLHHRLQLVTQLVDQDQREAALDVILAARKRLDEQKAIRWCRSTVLDAVFSSYFDQAHRQDIRVETHIALPEPLPVDEQELAIVFANALENAIHACMALPRDRRIIRCRVIHRPSLMLEISNPCASTVQFSDEGLPISARQGHGLGVQSIRAFCRKYGALCHYQYQDSWFTLQVVL